MAGEVAEWSIAAVLKTASGLRPTGVRIPPSPPEIRIVKEYLPIIVGVAIAGAIFAFLWSKGYLFQLSTYVQETKEELRKCSWPTREELKGSTVVVMVSAALLGAFTVGIDFVIAFLVKAIS